MESNLLDLFGVEHTLQTTDLLLQMMRKCLPGRSDWRFSELNY